MADLSGPANPTGQYPGPPEYSISESARMLAGDSSKDTKLLQENLSKLKSAKLSKLKDILHKYQEMLSKESRDDPAKAAAFNERLHGLLNDPDLMDLLNEIAKGGAGAEAMAIALMSAIADLEGDNAIKGTGVAGQDDGDRRARRRNLLALGVAGMVVLLALFFGIRFLNPPGSKAGSVQAMPPNANLVPPTITPTCSLDLVNPTSADQIPESGPLNVQWSSVPVATSYALKVIPPPSFSVPWLFPAQGNSRTIYMENFTAPGDYQLAVDALDANGGVLCGTALKFKRSAYVAPSGKKGDTGGGGGSAPCRPSVVYVTCP